MIIISIITIIVIVIIITREDVYGTQVVGAAAAGSMNFRVIV